MNSCNCEESRSALNLNASQSVTGNTKSRKMKCLQRSRKGKLKTHDISDNTSEPEGLFSIYKKVELKPWKAPLKIGRKENQDMICPTKCWSHKAAQAVVSFLFSTKIFCWKNIYVVFLVSGRSVKIVNWDLKPIDLQVWAPKLLQSLKIALWVNHHLKQHHQHVHWFFWTNKGEKH